MAPIRQPWIALTVLREKDGYNKTAFAVKLGVSLGHLSDLESGRRKPTVAHIKLAATLLNVPQSMLEIERRDRAMAC